MGGLALAYFVAGKAGLRLAFLQPSASPVWPPVGIAVAALLVLGSRTWPAVFVGAFLVNVTTAGNVGTSVVSMEIAYVMHEEDARRRTLRFTLRLALQACVEIRQRGAGVVMH